MVNRVASCNVTLLGTQLNVLLEYFVTTKNNKHYSGAVQRQQLMDTVFLLTMIITCWVTASLANPLQKGYYSKRANTQLQVVTTGNIDVRQPSNIESHECVVNQVLLPFNLKIMLEDYPVLLSASWQWVHRGWWPLLHTHTHTHTHTHWMITKWPRVRLQQEELKNATISSKNR